MAIIVEGDLKAPFVNTLLIPSLHRCIKNQEVLSVVSNYPNHHHHHHVVPLARISLTLSRHFSLLFIAFGRSSGLHPVFSHSCCMYVRAGRPAFAWPYAGVHRSTSLMSSSLLLQQCPACLARLTCIVFVMGGKWPYIWYLVGCCRQDLFNIALNILVYLPSSFFFSRLVSVQVVHPYSNIDTTAVWKKLRFILFIFPYDREPIDICPCFR